MTTMFIKNKFLFVPFHVKNSKQTSFQFAFFFVVAAFFWVIFAYTCIWNWMLSISLTLVFSLFPVYSRWLSIDGIKAQIPITKANTFLYGWFIYMLFFLVSILFVRNFIVVVFFWLARTTFETCAHALFTHSFSTLPQNSLL